MEPNQPQPPGIPGQNVPAATPVYVQGVAPKTSGMAITSLVLGIIGLIPCFYFTFGLIPLIGLILGIISLRAIAKKLGQLKGKGMAIAGVVMSGVGVVLNLLWIVMFFFAAGVGGISVFRAMRTGIEAGTNTANMHQICMGVGLYADGNDSFLPDPETWQDQIKPYTGHPDGIPESPYEDVSGCGFAMNSLLVDTVEGQRVALKIDKIADPSKTVLFFESGNNSPPSGGPDLLPDEPRGFGGYLIGFVDGNVEYVEWDDLEDLNWSADGSEVYEFDDSSD